MFSVDNFYDFFYSEYGLTKTKNFIKTFQPHGAKDLHNLEPFGIDSRTMPDFFEKLNAYGRIIMHDQEPFFLNYIDTYRTSLLDQKKLFLVDNKRQNQLLECLTRWAQEYDTIGFLRRAFGGKTTHIICHSEKYSDDIASLEKQGFITCYYWWHGMIARDWYRHWHHYKILGPMDKHDNHERFLLYSRATDGTRTYRKTLIEHCREFQDRVRHNWKGDHVDSSFSAKIEVSDAFAPIHIVAETLFETNKVYLTEKVFKPMVMSQAFIIFGPPRSLEYLRDYGFKTFDQCWDESYDHEMDHQRRMSKLLDLIDYLRDLPREKFQELYLRALTIIEHNRNRFFSQAFQDDLILEMRNNMDRALLEQYQRHQHSLDYESNADRHSV